MFKKAKRLTVTLLILFFFLVTSYFQLWDRLENFVYDAWFKAAGEKNPGDQIVIIGIGEKSVYELGPEPTAWPRSVHGGLLWQLREARAVGFDIVFDTPGDPAENAVLANAIAQHGKVVLAYYFGFEESEGETYGKFQMPLDEFLAGAASIGYINTPKDPDNVVRRVMAAFPAPQAEGQFMPNFGLATALVAEGLDPNAISLPRPGELKVGERVVPVDDQFQALINFWGPGGTFPTYEYSDVLYGRIDPALFKDRICLVGPTDVLLRDYENIPFTRGNLIMTGALPTPGVEIHANSIKTFLEESYFKQVPFGVNLLLLVLVWGLTTLLTMRRSPLAGLAIVSSIIFGVCVMAYGMWSARHLWINCATPVVLALVTYTGVTAESYLAAEAERRKTRALFSRYVSPAVVEELTNQPDLVELGGKRQDVTVLFSDIRGFTSYSEDRSPEEVVGRLNEYLSAMTAMIFKHGGMIDKYMGDGIMAVFGAPVPQADHAARAIRASQDMREALVELNRGWEARGEALFNIGIGLSSGPVVVGNVGSSERMDYTVIGAEVNLSSRLESLTKEHKTQLILSDRTLQSLRDSGVEAPWEFEELGAVPVRGFTEPIKIFTIR